jgi:hypothetical protein
MLTSSSGMRIKGPTDGPRPPDAVDEAGGVDGLDESAPASTGGVERVGGPGGPDGTDAVGEVAARLRAGEITSDEALELLIDDAIQRQLGGAVASEHEEELRQLLRNYAATDPYLAAKIRRLTVK